MDGFFFLLILLVVGCILCGPAALVIGIIALNKSKEIYHQLQEKGVFAKRKAEDIPGVEVVPKPPVVSEEKPGLKEPERPTEVIAAAKVEEPRKVGQEVFRAAVEQFKEKERIITGRKTAALEQRIGTRWVLFAGVITVIVGMGFFLKYAYDNMYIGPLGRVVIAAVSGLAALAVGEVTRRRGYGIVAKAVTALGFALLYGAVFSAYRFYELIDSTPAFVLAILVTAAAMLYAVSLDEIAVALLSLLGGFLTPVIVSTGENLPVPLFSYVLVLGVGAMLCAYYRKWRAVNLLAFAGTYLLYIGWFEKFFRPAMKAAEGMPEQMTVALGWLGAFFAVYLVLPILYELVRKVKAQKEDVLLVLANAAVVFYYLWTILFDDYRVGLAFCAIGLCAAHLAVMSIVIRRCRDDVNLRLGLLVIGLFFLTIAVPLYLKMYAVAMAWAMEGVVLAIIGLRYRSIWTQVGGATALLLSVGKLLYQLPMHTGAFRLALNPAFGTWCFVAAVLFVCHIIYRRSWGLEKDLREWLAQILYGSMGLLLLAAATMEWYWYCKYNLVVDMEGYVSKGQMIIFAGLMMLFAFRPICPKVIMSEVLGLIFAAAGSVAALVVLHYFHSRNFVFFANVDFLVVLVFIAALVVYHLKYRRISESTEEPRGMITHILYAAIGTLLLSVIAAEWYWHCKYNLVDSSSGYLSKGLVIIFAAMMPVFIIRPICPKGISGKILASFLAGGGSIFTMIAFAEFHRNSFVIFANVDFGIALVFVTALFLVAWLLKRAAEQEKYSAVFATLFALAGVFVLWVLLTEEIYQYWHCRNRYVGKIANWGFLANMYISVAWAVYGAALMVIGFGSKSRMLRYIALGLFALLLGKVFILDTSTVKSVYRIAAFLATGVTLVGVSYLYQFLKNKGFFEAMLSEKSFDE